MMQGSARPSLGAGRDHFARSLGRRIGFSDILWVFSRWDRRPESSLASRIWATCTITQGTISMVHDNYTLIRKEAQVRNLSTTQDLHGIRLLYMSCSLSLLRELRVGQTTGLGV